MVELKSEMGIIVKWAMLVAITYYDCASNYHHGDLCVL